MGINTNSLRAAMNRLYKKISAYARRRIVIFFSKSGLAGELQTEKERVYGLLFDNLPQRIFYKDQNSVYVSVNKSYAADHNLSPEEFVGKTDFDLFPRELAAKYRADDIKTVKTGKRMETFETYQQNGELLTIYTIKIPIYGRNRRVLGILGIFWDITKQENTEKALRESERQKRIVFDQAFEFIGLMTLDGVLIEANRAAMEFAGIKEKDAINKYFWETPWWTHSPQQQERLRHAIQAVAQGEFVRFEATHKDNNNVLHYVDFSLKPVKDDNGKVIAMVPEGRDITEQKLMEITLRERDIQYHALIETTGTGFLVVDSNGSVLDANEEYVRLTGYRALEEILGRNVLEWTAPASKNKNRNALSMFFEEGHLRNMEVDYIAPSGKIIPIEINATVFEMEGGRYGLALCRDITERREQEKAFRELEVAKQASEAASKAKSAFLSTMSHELRTPLTSIIVSSEMLHKEMIGELSVRQHEYVNNVLAGGQHLLSLIEDILDMARIEAGKMELSFDRKNIKQLFGDVMNLLREPATSSGVAFIENIEETEILIDARRCKQILINLIANAIKFTPRGGTVTLDVGSIGLGKLASINKAVAEELSAAFPQAQNYLLISVRDTGIGIKAEDIPKLFKPFAQLDSSNTRNYEGPGLGLFMAKKLVELHNGRIWVESEYGKGSALSFVLPFEQGGQATILAQFPTP